jgi:hypothetical protein
VHNELIQQEQTDVVIVARLTHLEWLVDHVEQAQQVDKEEREERYCHKGLSRTLDCGEQQQQQDQTDETDDHGIGRREELLALDVLDAQGGLPKPCLLLS